MASPGGKERREKLEGAAHPKSLGATGLVSQGSQFPAPGWGWGSSDNSCHSGLEQEFLVWV